MGDDRKKITAGFWISVAFVAVLVGYPLSIGPAQWLIWNTEIPGLAETGHFVYAPIGWACHKSQRLRKATTWYVGLWVDYNKAPGVNLPPGGRFPSSWKSTPW